MSLVAVAGAIGTGVVLGRVKAEVYTELGSRNHALDGTNNHGDNISNRYKDFMKAGAIDGAVAGGAGALSSMRNFSFLSTKGNAVLKEFGLDIGQGAYDMAKKENRDLWASGQYGQWGLTIFGTAVAGHFIGKAAKNNLDVFQKPTSSQSKAYILNKKEFKTYDKDVYHRWGKKRANGKNDASKVDAYNGKVAVDVTNTDVRTLEGQQNLKDNIIEQYHREKANLPKGTEQRFVVDIRRQPEFTKKMENELIAEIEAKTGSDITVEFIY